MPISDRMKKVNKPQRIIVAIIIPLIILFVAYASISSAGYRRFGYGGHQDFYPLQDFDKTWWMWTVALILIGVFEFFWFRDRTTSSLTD